MSTVGTIESLLAIYLGKTSTSDLTINGFDAGKFAINAARRLAERAHDFKYSEANAFLSVGSAGALLTDAYIDTSATVTGTLSPNVSGSFARSGNYNGLPFFTRTVSSVVYFLSFSGTAWTITAGGFTLGSNYWSLTTMSSSPAGAYTATGANTGTATVTSTSGSIGVKRVTTVALPVAGTEYLPIEFLTNDQWLARLRMQTGRTSYDPSMSLEKLGVATGNPLAYQNGQTLYLYPSSLTLPIVAQLNIVRWMPDYTASTDNDFFTLYGQEYLQWQSILEMNKYFRRFIPKQESNVDETAIKDMADAALASLIAWDGGTEKSTSTPQMNTIPAQAA